MGRMMPFPVASSLIILAIPVLAQQHSVIIHDAAELQSVFITPVESLHVTLMPGEYHLVPTAIIDSTCGNCENANTPVEATVGLHIRGKYVRITGPEDRSAIIHTHAGYGLFFEGCTDGLIENVTITGGQRDTNGNATDAAIVVKNSSVSIRNNLITDNIGDSAIVAAKVVGIMGICGRENSNITITGNRIIRNSWDGIVLYRDAVGIVENNIIDGVDKARGAEVGGGRGVGIGITWTGRATIRNNLVTRYWKGIGLFVDANGVVEGNIVEDILTWGIAYWDAGKGAPVGVIENNIIYKTGACGASITRERQGENPGRFTGNTIVETAQNERYDASDYYCYQCALALHAVPDGFVLENNIFHNNRRATADLPDHDLPLPDFLEAVRNRCPDLLENPLFDESLFVRNFCRGDRE